MSPTRQATCLDEARLAPARAAVRARRVRLQPGRRLAPVRVPAQAPARRLHLRALLAVHVRRRCGRADAQAADHSRDQRLGGRRARRPLFFPRLATAIERWVLRNASGLVFVSSVFRDRVRRAHGEHRASDRHAERRRHRQVQLQRRAACRRARALAARRARRVRLPRRLRAVACDRCIRLPHRGSPAKRRPAQAPARWRRRDLRRGARVRRQSRARPIV